ncbi:NAD(P)-binding domain-containing protein [Planctomonas deserti]|uniref:NAD(P)-binding domain-containing protein n=1 Tax=Planctomonas deserti TaxID=2144185 RepID=UPI000D371535|nr:NAD(P)-binding domain-containing protein [Planctomonas deserti]
MIIGAGQAGLSVAYHLKRGGLRMGEDVVILDRGPAEGGAWQHRWEALRLGSAHRVNDLPGMREMGLSFDTADRDRPARDVVREYYREYERFYDLRVLRPVVVTAVQDDGSGLVVRHERGEHHTAAVVNATDTWGAPYLPYYPGVRRFAGIQTHTAGYRSAEDFRGLRVLVVGGGTSAIGFLLELENVAERTIWSTRRPVDYLERSDLDLESALAAVAAQDAASRAGETLPSIVSGTGVPRTERIAAGIDRGLLVSRGPFAELEEHAVVWPDGSRDAIDAILWATGFRPEVRHLAPLGLRERAGGIAVTLGVSERDPRLFFAGYGPQASTIGANRAGKVIARQVLRLVA